ncbi:MAG: MFS transporter [Ectothiorhodospiraceae bacterium]|nr:MFS transporter [Ectothiorhodospiraceae bacterium]
MSTVAHDASRRDVLTIGLVGVAHGCSHFFQLVLPPLFPFLTAEFGVSYTELGILMTTFFVTSGVGQPLAGFLVDRIGARQVMLAGLGIYSLAIFALALAPSFWVLFPAIVMAGLGNCVFHPADFAVLNASVHRSRLGRAFGVHTLGGNLGWVAAPALVVPVAGVAGWRVALATAAAVGAIIWLALWLNRRSLRDERDHAPAGAPAAAGIAQGLSLLASRPLLLCFGYFALVAAALIAVQNFLSPILGSLHGTPLTVAASGLTAYLLGAAVGVMVGGVVADRSDRHVAIVAAGLLGASLVFIAVAQLSFVATALIATLAAGGFLSGFTNPSRDLIVRSATPRGASGRVFGFVYSGLDVGSALAPITVGLLLDHGHPQWALWAIAGVLFAAIFTVVTLRGAIPSAARPSPV